MSGHPAGSQPGSIADAGTAAATLALAWYLGRDGQQFGPVSDAEFRRLYESGQLKPTDLVWREGFAEWRPVSSMQPPTPVTPAPQPLPPHGAAPAASGAPSPTSQHASARRAPIGNDAIAAAAQHRPQTTPQKAPAASESKSGQRAARQAHPSQSTRPGTVAGRGRLLGRGLAWIAIATFFALTLGAAYFVVAGDKNLMRMAIALIPNFGDKVVITAPIGGFAKTVDATDQALQKSLLWQVLKKHHADWYAERVRDATEAKNANLTDAQIATTMMQAVVKLRRQYAADATSAPVDRLKSIASLFTANLVRLRSQSIDTCYQFVSSGESAPAVVALLQSTDHTSGLQAQLAATFEAISEGRRTPRIYPRPKAEDYDALVANLETRGWKEADLQLFSDSTALANASPETVCRLVTQWFESQIAIQDPDAQLRLLVDSLRPVVAG